ncbi:hypothetical protein C8R44DRAFT_927760 [Mycena epipterygia]|nr:hypothetical protein C8R44DRAFT_927760 [Mycena epipterygia]
MLGLKLSMLPLLTLALAANAYPERQARAPSIGLCSDPAVVGNTTIQVGAAQVLMSSFSCASDSGANAYNSRTPGAIAARTTRNVCHEQCTIVSCIGTGDVPASSDCAIIADAIGILSADLGPTYLLNASNGYFKQLVYGTCLTFIGVSAQEDTEACWSDWASIINQLLSACPGSPNGACTSAPPALTFADFLIEIRATDSV